MSVSFPPFEEMENFFINYVEEHRKLVRKYLSRIHAISPLDWYGLKSREETHDSSKLKDPEKTPYVYYSWCMNKGFPPTEEISEEVEKAVHHHVLNNSHHPEFHAKEVGFVWNGDSRVEKLIYAHNMPLLDLGEMVADWCAMSEAKATDPRDWADKNIGTRWSFNKQQVSLIYGLLDEVFW